MKNVKYFVNKNNFDDFDDYITNDSSYHEKRRIKRRKTTFNFTTKKR